MPNTIITPQVYTNELLRKFKMNLGFASATHHEYDERFAKKGGKIGDTVNARVPVKFVAEDGADLVPQDVEERSVPITLNRRKHVAFAFTSQDLTLSIDRFAERYLDSAAVALANIVDVDGLIMAYKNTHNFVGVPGTIPSAIKTYNQAGAWLDKMGCPFDNNRSVCISPDMQVEIVDALKALFQSSTQIASQYEKGRMGKAAGFNWIMDQNVRTHTTGQCGGTPLVNGADQTGSSILTEAWTSAAANRLKAGDVVGFAGVYAVGPVSGDNLADLARFTVTEDIASTSGGAATLKITPALTITGPYKNASNAPANDAQVYVFDKAPASHSDVASKSSPQGIAFHKEAFGFAMVPLVLPRGVEEAASSIDQETGVSIRTVSDYDIQSDKFYTRCDILYGWAPLIPEFACRVVS